LKMLINLNYQEIGIFVGHLSILGKNIIVKKNLENIL